MRIFLLLFLIPAVTPRKQYLSNIPYETAKGKSAYVCAINSPSVKQTGSTEKVPLLFGNWSLQNFCAKDFLVSQYGDGDPNFMRDKAVVISGSFMLIKGCDLTKVSNSAKELGITVLILCSNNDRRFSGNTKDLIPMMSATNGMCTILISNGGTIQPFNVLHYNKYFSMINFLPILIIAVGVMALGVHLGAVIRLQEQMTGNNNDVIGQPKSKSGVSNACWVVYALCMVGFMCTILVLMFFFYDVIVYIIIALFTIGATYTIHWLSVWAVTSLYQKLKGIEMSKIDIPFCNKEKKCSVYWVTFIILPLAVAFCVTWAVFRNSGWSWWMLGFMGASVCIFAMCKVRFGSLKLLVILLVCLFFYDIFSVFVTPYIKALSVAPPSSAGLNPTLPPSYNYTQVRTSDRVKRSSSGQTAATNPPIFDKSDAKRISIMEAIATGASGKSNETAPLAFKVPHIMSLDPCNSSPYSLLGFGDVVLPALLLVFAHYCDFVLQSSGRGCNCCKWLYYWCLLVSYAVALCLAFMGTILMSGGQPALLYIVPLVVSCVLFLAFFRGHLGMMWSGDLPEPPAAQVADISTSNAAATSANAAATEQENTRLVNTDQ